tara:strand:+ start:772 stop:975 length:204 start_codon:yes stop_codon:yes gene_type:complete
MNTDNKIEAAQALSEAVTHLIASSTQTHSGSRRIAQALFRMQAALDWLEINQLSVTDDPYAVAKSIK